MGCFLGERNFITSLPVNLRKTTPVQPGVLASGKIPPHLADITDLKRWSCPSMGVLQDERF